MRKIFRHFAFAVFLFLPALAGAHEKYVLTPEQVKEGLAGHANVYAALLDPGHWLLMSAIGILTLLGLAASVYWWRTSAGSAFSAWLEKFSDYAILLVRITLAASLFLGAWTNSFMGPEISLSSIPGGGALKIVLVVASLLILLGLYTRPAAWVALAAFLLASVNYNWYVMTYFNYLGEIIALIIFGGGRFSWDARRRGRGILASALAGYEGTVLRISLGVALLYTAITVKFLHPALTLGVVENFHLTKYHLLFPSDPMLVVAGAGIVEVAIALFIIFGFQSRLAAVVTTFYLTLSLLYFREMVWPHLLLYGILAVVLACPQKLAIDNILTNDRRKQA